LGGSGNDILFGGNDDDQLLGWTGQDLLGGGSGRDYLYGGVDGDTLTGGSEADTFVLRIGDNVTKGVIGADVITDYADGEDKIGLTDSLIYIDLAFAQ
jgi:Ca2+-binding RTX toxin-like protein